jgi:hypothetical protein
VIIRINEAEDGTKNKKLTKQVNGKFSNTASVDENK